MGSNSNESDMQRVVSMCKEGSLCTKCSAPSGNEFGNMLTEMLNEMTTLTQQVSSLKQCMDTQHTRLQYFEGNNNEGRDSEGGSSSAAEASVTVRSPKDRAEKVF